MTATRPRNASQTRADILSAARRRFGAEGYERTTLRAVAADVGVDAALVIRYFGSKQNLFAAAADFSIDLPDLSDVDPDEVAGILLPRFFAVWEEDETFLALLRAAMTSPVAADALLRARSAGAHGIRIDATTAGFSSPTLSDAGFKTGDSGLQFSLRDQSSSGQNSGNQTGSNAQRLVVSEEDTIPAAVAGRTYGRMLGSSSGVDISV